MNGAARPQWNHQAQAVRTVLANPSVRDTQVALAGARAVDLAQLVVVSAFLFTHGGAALVAIYGITRTLAPAVGVPLVTALGCRLGHGVLLGLMGIVGALGSFTMAAVAASDGPTIGLLAGAGVVGVALGCFRPVIGAILPALVRSPAELLASNAASGFFDGVSTLLGPVLGSVIGGLLGVPTLLVVTGGVMAAVGLVATRRPTAAGMGPSAREFSDAGRIAEFVAGSRELTTNPGARLVTLLGTAQTFIRGAMSVIVVVFAIEVVSIGESGVGALYAAIGVGGLVGLPVAVFVVSRLGLHRSLAWGLTAWGAPLAICAFVGKPGMAALLFGVIGVGNGVIDVCYFGAFQRLVADRVLARVLGAAEAMLQAGVAAGAAAGAVLLDRVGTRPALLVVGLVLPALAALASRRLRSLDRILDGRDLEIALLQGLACFAPLPMIALDHVADRMARVGFAAGQVIAVAGTPTDSYLLIEEGTVEIAHRGRISALLGPGQGFGDLALPQNVLRMATVSARSAVSARAIDRTTFLASINADPAARAAAEHEAAVQWL